MAGASLQENLELQEGRMRKEDRVDTVFQHTDENYVSESIIMNLTVKNGTKTSAEEPSKTQQPLFPIPGYFGRLKSLLVRNFTRSNSSSLFLILLVLVSGMEVASMYLYFEQGPDSISLGVYNGELTELNMTECTHKPVEDCYAYPLSCKLMQFLSNEKLDLINYGSKEQVLTATKEGKVNGYFAVHPDFTSNLQDVILFRKHPPEKKFQVDVEIDSMDPNYSSYMNRRTSCAIRNFLMTHRISCQINRDVYVPSMFVAQDIDYGDDNFRCGEYSPSGTFLLLCFIIPMMFSYLLLFVDEADGTYQHGVSDGVRVTEYYIAQWITQTFLLILQSFLSFLLIWIAVGMNFGESIFYTMTICMFVGEFGIVMAFVMSTICTNMITLIHTPIGILITAAMVSRFEVDWPMPELGIFLDLVGIVAFFGILAESVRISVINGLRRFPQAWALQL